MDDAVGGLGGEELALALIAAVDGDEEDGGAIGGEEGADGVELRGEDLEDDERKGELPEGGAHVGALKGALGGADLDEPGGGCQYSCLEMERLGIEADRGWETGLHAQRAEGGAGSLLFGRQHHGTRSMEPQVQILLWIRLHS